MSTVVIALLTHPRRNVAQMFLTSVRRYPASSSHHGSVHLYLLNSVNFCVGYLWSNRFLILHALTGYQVWDIHLRHAHLIIDHPLVHVLISHLKLINLDIAQQIRHRMLILTLPTYLIDVRQLILIREPRW